MQTIATLLTTAFGLIAALAWNEQLSHYYNLLERKRSVGLFIYAIIITIIAVVATY